MRSPSGYRTFRRFGRAAPRAALRSDFLASLVVFLVALPLCVGVAVASGVPPELGLATGIVGGLVAGLLPGSSLQVSGPAAGLTVLVYEAVQAYGLSVLGVLVLMAGVLQMTMGALRLGRWFRAISVAVVQGMLAGIGLVLVAGQVYGLADARAPEDGLGKLRGLPGLVREVLGSAETLVALAVGAGTVLVLVVWPRLRGVARLAPAPLVAVGLAAGVVGVWELPVTRIEVRGLVGALQPPGGADFARLIEVGVLGTVLAFTLIASAESLFSAAAVDRMHDGTRTDYDKELMAQGAGNAVCGVLGALPMTAVIVRSSANVRAGARTKLSRVLHSVWLLVFVVLLPQVLGLIPVAALAGVLVYAGWQLLPLREFATLWREHRGEAVVLTATAVSVVLTNLFEGVLLGLLLAVVKSAWETSHVHLEIEETGGEAGGEGEPRESGAPVPDRAPGDAPLRVRVVGNATFLRLPKLLDQLAELPRDRPVVLDLSGLRHLDLACRTALEGWAVEAEYAGRAEAGLEGAGLLEGTVGK
ncbi:SulP family inorganic anion transporter [Streptomyces axinellae]|uniref:SulP family inorganic anion transporter n=1 Tax=Streptomyces axinellae TaxID=552788 RepID=A0ABP6CCS4_9ACTN